ncbi:16S rRNA (guanine(966)-N(2))-methyltransferase RsmD [Brevibacterium sp. BRM-1]|uniref:16S rRNA (guanine(966)-N(2))-methyltransferase RsmD n=1 Tax=Brevibacterium sp. BRM-1 TaxID=2999062 RepID=UPI0022827205|nr:16S rRNA (guanine(966)-N(2))-methyltransferase RsmD [Brevibacterium sp. BRM-1]WAL41338.1 16S rRNA (guanine(966)-N(2))-methyltransferase RsmD [Brevibacterium sp. BRM-1]
MRIVAGRHASRPLRTPPGDGTRPTSDRVRESLFGSLESLGMLAGAQVLDVFAGSGALGLEALSRGAARAVFVERAAGPARVIAANAAALGEGAAAEVRVQAALPALAALAQEGRAFDLVLADPPYPLPEAQVSAVLTAAAALLADDASLLVLERSARSPEPDAAAAGLALYDTKSYGETAVYLFERAR